MTELFRGFKADQVHAPLPDNIFGWKLPWSQYIFPCQYIAAKLLFLEVAVMTYLLLTMSLDIIGRSCHKLDKYDPPLCPYQYVWILHGRSCHEENISKKVVSMKDCPMLAIKNELTMLNYWKEKHWKIIYSIDPIKLMLSNVELLKTIAKALLIMLNVDNHCWQSLLTIIVDTCRSSLHWTNPSLQTCATVLSN